MKSVKILVMLLVSMLLLSIPTAFSGVPKQPHNGNAMWIEDADAPYSSVNLTTADPLHTLGYKFNITVWLNMTTLVSPAVGIDTWSAKVYFNKDYLKALRCDYTEAGPPKTSQLFKGIGTIPVTPVIDNVGGFVWHSETIAPLNKLVPCSGSLFWIEFNVTKVPGKGETLTALFNIVNVDTAVADNAGAIYPPNPITRYNGFYEFKWEPPPPANMAVEHDGFYGVPPPSPGPNDAWPLIYGPYPPTVNGSSFDTNIYIENLAAAWGLANATFCLCYNTTVIDALGPAPKSVKFDLIEALAGNPDGPIIPPEFTVNPDNYYASGSTDEFNVTVGVKNVDAASRLIAVEFRLSYDPTVLDVVGAVNGSFLPYWASQQPGSLDSFFVNFTESDGLYGPHVHVGGMILPNGTGQWNPPWPVGSGDIAIITFKEKVVGPLNITLNTAVWDPDTSVITVTHGVPDEINFTVYPKAGIIPSGAKVLVATVRFTIMIQRTVPPYPSGYYDVSTLTFCGVVLRDHTRAIDTTAPKEGEVRILAMMGLPMAWLEVSPKDTVLRTSPCHTVLKGTEFDVNVTVKNLDEHWYLVAWQFRLSFDPTLLQFVGGTEGPFLKDPRWDLYGTFFTCGWDPSNMFPAHVWAGCLLFPNGAGEYDQTTFPSAPGPDVPALKPPVDPVLATIRFKALKQECFGGHNLTCALDILPFWMPTDCHFGDKDGNFIPDDASKFVNGTYTIMPMYEYGRIVDVYGGAVNRGYGTALGTSYKGVGVIWPEGFGGQGYHENMDLVIPQSVVYLFAKVTYNCWPVQSKDVGFEIDGPYEQDPQGGFNASDPRTWIPKDLQHGYRDDPYHVRKYSNRTDTGDCQNPGGVAWIKFQMPWPCDNPESYFGKYRVTASVDICGVVVTDVLWFDYYYLVEITKVTTDKYCYPHCNDVEVTIEFRSKAQQEYPVLFAVVLQDELETHVSADYGNTTIGGAKFCHWKTYDPKTLTVHVEKWAFAGIGHIYVSAFDWDPTDISPITGQHGAPWLPTFGMGWPLQATVPEICIYPY